ncbi:zinc ribbon domain-containing protein [bacterium]|nr:zinc ribbon domain-containing protein [bacterium]MBU1937520.1 zinc ribbon domain-containing protein [bacterium]
MPIFEYHCSNCDARFEEWVSTWRDGEKIKCPHCGSEETERQVSRFASGSSGSISPSCGPGYFR